MRGLLKRSWMLVLLGAGCGGEVVGEGGLEGDELVLVAPASSSFHAATADGTPQVVYVNFDGVTLAGSDGDDAPNNRSFALKGGLGLSSFTFGAFGGNRQYILDKLRAAYAPYNVTFTTSRPGSGPYTMLVISPSNPGGWWGVSPLDCGNGDRNNVALVFKTGSQGGDEQVWRSAAHELAHTFGLGHSKNSADIMQWASSGSQFTVSQYSWYSGKFYCTGTGADGDVQDEPGLLRQALGTAGATSPAALQPDPGDPELSVARNVNRGLEAVVRAPDGGIYYRHQPCAGCQWSAWQRLGNLTASQPPLVIPDASGRLVVFAVGTDGAVYHAWQTTIGGATYTAWYGLGGNVASPPVAIVSSTGGLALFALGSDGTLRHAWQFGPGTNWSGWVSLGGNLTSTPVIQKTYNGAMVAFTRGANNEIWHAWQPQPGSTWTGWVSLGGNFTSAPAVFKTSNNAFSLFARGTDGALWTRWQTSAGGNWSGWVSLGGSLSSAPVVTLGSTGGMVAFARGANNDLVTAWQPAPGSTWSGWVSLGGSLTSAPRIEVASTGGLVAFMRGTDGGLWHTWQPQPGSLWSGWFSLGGGLAE